MRRGSTSITVNPRSSSTPQGYPINSGRLHDHGFHAALGPFPPVGRDPSVKAVELAHRLLSTVYRHCYEVAAGAHINTRCVQIHLGKLCGQMSLPVRIALWLCPKLASYHHLPYHGGVGASPEEATDNEQSTERGVP